ncbi:MAG: hypothetical protein H7Z16_06555 [Pyrinomonadaceae bacterium]|nr:hypothetical protein [Pyrinomonadaceae bacterium]
MNSHHFVEQKTSQQSSPRVVSYFQLGIIVMSFIAGVVAALILRNILSSESIVFSTTSLISFLFGIALSAASIVLAVVAIALGKSSERVMIDRSDQSITLQNEVFIKTTEALGRIESSTGVTEKRIEDIISGRAGAISHRIADRLAESKGTATPKSRKSIEEEVKQSLIEEFSVERRKKYEAEVAEKEKVRQQALEKYTAFRDAVLQNISKEPSVMVLKLEPGKFDSEGNDLVDGVFEIREQKIAVDVISTALIVEDYFTFYFPKHLTDLSKEIAKGTFTKCYLVFDDAIDDSDFRKVLDEFRAIMRTDISARMPVVTGDVESVSKMIIEELNKADSGNGVGGGFANPRT